MKKQRDWMDYANLVSSVLQNGQLVEVQKGLDEIKKVQLRGLQLTASIQEREELKAALDKQRQNVLWGRIQGLEKLKPKLSDSSPVHAFIFLHRFDLPFAADDFNDWSDKQRLNDFLTELASLKSQAKSKLASAQIEDAQKAIKAASDLEPLNRFLVMRRMRDEHQARIEKLDAELNDLNQQKKSAGFFASLTNGMDDKIAKVESEQSDVVLRGPFMSLVNANPSVDSLLNLIKMAEAEEVDSLADDYREQRDTERTKLAQELEDEYHELFQKFLGVQDLIAYRIELIEAVKRVWGMNSVQEVEDFILGKDNSFKLGEIQAEIPQPYLQPTLSSPQPSTSSQTTLVSNGLSSVQKSNQSMASRDEPLNVMKQFALHPAIIWMSRILGVVGMFGAMQLISDALKGTAKPDAPGLGQAIFIFLVFTLLAVHGFWPRKKK